MQNAAPTDESIAVCNTFLQIKAKKLLTLQTIFDIILDCNGVWHSLVVRLVRDQEVVGSNPVTPTIIDKPVSRYL